MTQTLAIEIEGAHEARICKHGEFILFQQWRMYSVHLRCTEVVEKGEGEIEGSLCNKESFHT